MKNNALIIVFLLSAMFLLAFTLIVLPAEIEYQPDQENSLIFIYRVEKPQEIQFKTRLDVNNSIAIENMNSYIQFYNQFTKNSAISREIILNSLKYDVPVHISFSIAWVESRFTATAISRVNRNGSRDWGLFQLNDSYRNWTRNQYFNIELNSQEGISYYKWCFDQLDDIILALKAYNAGITRVLNGSDIPISTYRYVDEILEFEGFLDKKWNESFGS